MANTLLAAVEDCPESRVHPAWCGELTVREVARRIFVQNQDVEADIAPLVTAPNDKMRISRAHSIVNRAANNVALQLGKRT